jgi:DNA repair photolyase
VLVAPIIPAINDAELKATLARARALGACDAGYVLLRLPLQVRERFAERHRDYFRT